MNGAVRPHIPKMEKIISEVKNAVDIFDCDLRNIKILSSKPAVHLH